MTAPTTADLMFACQESLDADTPTPLEFAFELLGVAHRRDVQKELVSMTNDSDVNPRCLFSEGWDAGIDATLDDSQMPGRASMYKEARAWLVGFISGQFALANGYPTPFCIFEDHEH